jgi:hypothetical protein
MVVIPVGVSTVASAGSVRAASVFLHEGSRVRVRVVGSSEPQIGTLARASGDSVLVRYLPDARPVAVSAAQLSTFETSLGKKGNTRKGAVVGFVVGTVVGVAYGISWASEPNNDFAVHEIAATGLIVGGVGALLGAIAGVAIRTERWEAVAPPWETATARTPNRSIRLAVAVPLSGRTHDNR